MPFFLLRRLSKRFLSHDRSYHLDDTQESFAVSLRQCRAQRSLSLGKYTHRRINQSGLHNVPQLSNLLVQMYGKCGDLLCAQDVFDHVSNKSALAWSLLAAAYAQNGHPSAALGLYDEMQCHGFLPSDFTISVALSACSTLRDFERGRSIHLWAADHGHSSNLLVQNALVNFYAKCCRIQEAMRLFDEMKEVTCVTWNALISAHVQNDQLLEALDLYREMVAKGVEPSSVTFAVILSACSSLGDEDEGRRIHALISHCGFQRTTVVQNGLVNFYAKCGCLDEARAIFDGILEMTVVSWSAMICSYALHGRGREALDLFERMKQAVEPNAVTFTGVLNACAVVEDLNRGREIHALLEARGELGSNTILENALLNMYVRCGSLKEARKVFDTMKQPDAFAWTNMIAACTENDELIEALEIFHRMELEGIPSTSVTLASVLNACACSGALKVGKQIHARVEASGFQSSVLVQTALLDMYAKCGSVQNSIRVFSAMETKNSVSWTAMIAAFAQHGQGDEAVELFKQMNLEGIPVDSTTFTCVLRGCSYAGLIKESIQFFTSMIEDHALAPSETHYGQALDIIGRAGRLQDADELIETMPFHPETPTWKTLLSACRIHSQAGRATQAADQLAKLAPEDSAAYTLLGNIYAATGIERSDADEGQS